MLKRSLWKIKVDKIFCAIKKTKERKEEEEGKDEIGDGNDGWMKGEKE